MVPLLHCIDVVVIGDTITVKRYVDEVLHPHALPISRTVGKNVLFQQDNTGPTLAIW